VNSKPASNKQSNFLTSDRMVVNILVSAAIAMIVITIAVGFGGDNPLTVWILVIATIIDIVGILLAARGITLPGRTLVPGILIFAAGFIAFTRGGLYHIAMSGFPVIIVLAGLLLGIRGSFIFAAFASIAAGIIGYADINGLNPFSEFSRTGYDDIAVATTLFFVTAIVLRVIIQRLTESIQEAELFGLAQESANNELMTLKNELEQRVEERTAELDSSNRRNARRAKQFEAIAQASRAISSTRDLDSLLVQITEVIHREFGFYHIGIFLLDTAKEYAVLSASNSAEGRRMLERGHRLRVGEKGIVGFVTGTGKPRVALDTGADAAYFDNPDLPETHSEIALPLRIGNEIIGALDAQSVELEAFDEEDVRTLGTLADQVSIAIQNALQFEETRRALAESESLSKQFIQTGWNRFTRTRKLEGVHHTGAKSTLLYRKPGNGEAEDASDRNQLKPRGRGAVLSLPVKLRGEVIGTVDVRSPENRQWDQDELDIVVSIIERSAIAMENARLLAESQSLAARERAIGEISAKISAQTDMDDLIKTAAQELGRVLPGMQIAIQYHKEETE